MASIQILEIRPVEDQVEDLSYDMTDSIRGGFDLGEWFDQFLDVQQELLTFVKAWWQWETFGVEPIDDF